MIYFDKETRIKLIRNISSVLHQGGYLFIGHSETLLEITDQLVMVRPTIYRKNNLPRAYTRNLLMLEIFFWGDSSTRIRTVLGS